MAEIRKLVRFDVRSRTLADVNYFIENINFTSVLLDKAAGSIKKGEYNISTPNWDQKLKELDAKQQEISMVKFEGMGMQSFQRNIFSQLDRYEAQYLAALELIIDCGNLIRPISTQEQSYRRKIIKYQFSLLKQNCFLINKN